MTQTNFIGITILQLYYLDISLKCGHLRFDFFQGGVITETGQQVQIEIASEEDLGQIGKLSPNHRIFFYSPF